VELREAVETGLVITLAILVAEAAMAASGVQMTYTDYVAVAVFASAAALLRFDRLRIEIGTGIGGKIASALVLGLFMGIVAYILDFVVVTIVGAAALSKPVTMGLRLFIDTLAIGYASTLVVAE